MSLIRFAVARSSVDGNRFKARMGLWATLSVAMLGSVSLAWVPAAQAAKVGDPAPSFTATDSHGKTHSLSDADVHGKYVVLEWHNHGCPYVKKHYNSGNMQKLQDWAHEKGVTWFTVISSAKGKEGYVTPAEENKYLADKKSHPTAALFDTDGVIGHAYGAKTTPHMFVIDPKGTLIYAGAIDDRESTEEKDVNGAKNYVKAALEEAMSGKPVTVSSTRSYGCGVKY